MAFDLLLTLLALLLDLCGDGRFEKGWFLIYTDVWVVMEQQAGDTVIRLGTGNVVMTAECVVANVGAKGKLV